MIEKRNTKILAFVGLAGAGKSAAVDYLTKRNYPKVYGGGIIVQAVINAGLEPTQENERAYREKKRAEEGKDVFIKMVTKEFIQLQQAGQHKIVFDGLYTWSEYKYLKHNFPGELITVAVVASKHLRHHRLAKRPFRPLTESEANERDWAEIENLEKGGPIAIADHYITNEGSLESLHNDIDEVLTKFDF